jgi:hypothetical protein
LCGCAVHDVTADFSDQARPNFSAWFNTHPATKWGAVTALGVVMLALIGSRIAE